KLYRKALAAGMRPSSAHGWVYSDFPIQLKSTETNPNYASNTRLICKYNWLEYRSLIDFIAENRG
ncbi:MAG: hypothetical protein PVI97_11550, partial [Candidatus Thiodiazotropha sp.]